MCPAVSQFSALFIVNLLIKTNSSISCDPCLLGHVCYEFVRL